MCLELFVLIKETPGFEPEPLLSPYVLTSKLSREKCRCTQKRRGFVIIKNT